MTWQDQPLAPLVRSLLGHGTDVDLAKSAGMARNTLRKVMRADYIHAPTRHLEAILVALQPRLEMFDLTLTMEQLVQAYELQLSNVDKHE